MLLERLPDPGRAWPVRAAVRLRAWSPRAAALAARLHAPATPLHEIPLHEGGTMVALPGGGCMVSDGTPNAMTPPEKRWVRYTTVAQDARCPQ